MKVEQLRPEHFDGLRLQGPQAYLSADRELAADLIALGPAFVGLVDDRPVAAAGVHGACHYWPQPMAWALLTEEAVCQHRRAFARHVREFLAGWRSPIDTTIDPRCPVHARWAAWLGFERVGAFPLVRPEDGATVDLWSRGRGH